MSCMRVIDIKLTTNRWSPGYVSLDTVLCSEVNMALRRGWKGEAEEANGIKEEFVSITLGMVWEKPRERARQLHVLGGKKGGEQRIIKRLYSMRALRKTVAMREQLQYRQEWQHQQKQEKRCFIRSTIYVPQKQIKRFTRQTIVRSSLVWEIISTEASVESFQRISRQTRSWPALLHTPASVTGKWANSLQPKLCLANMYAILLAGNF